MFKSVLCIVCDSFVVKLTFVEVHDKKESKLFSLASLRRVRFEFYIKIKPVETKIIYLLYIS
jgi:hypothetical protein